MDPGRADEEVQVTARNATGTSRNRSTTPSQPLDSSFPFPSSRHRSSRPPNPSLPAPTDPPAPPPSATPSHPARMTEAPFLPRERLFKQQQYFQNLAKHTHLKGRYDVVTSVAIPVALAASSLFMIGRGIYNMSHGIGKKE